jgi:hypothetical protein
MDLKQENYIEDHLNFLHLESYDWCALCQNQKNKVLGGQDLGISVGESLNMQDKFGR